jgi:tetratricopeptide (TPR) repeat protein
LAEAYAERCHFAEAEKLARESLQRRREILQKNHPEIATALNNLGEMLRTEGQPREAEQMFRESLDIWMEAAGPNYLETAVSEHNLATALADQKRYTEAEEMFGKALETLRLRLGPDHPKVLQVSKAYEDTRRLARERAAVGR